MRTKNTPDSRWTIWAAAHGVALQAAHKLIQDAGNSLFDSEVPISQEEINYIVDGNSIEELSFCSKVSDISASSYIRLAVLEGRYDTAAVNKVLCALEIIYV